MQRRAFIRLFGGAAVGWPLTAHAQQPAMALVGLLSAFQLDDRLISAVREGLKDAGYVEGRNAAIKYRSADGRFDRLPAMAVDLVSDPAAVIVALAPLAAVAAKNATTIIPIALDLVGPIPHPALQSMFDALYPPGHQWYWKAFRSPRFLGCRGPARVGTQS
jgi:putative ABC transport system substrate-binding protein